MNSSGGAGLQWDAWQALSLPWWGHWEAPKKGTKAAGDSSTKHLDSYVSNTEIVSRKYTRLSEVSEETAIRYLQKLTDKYASGSSIAEVPSNMGGANAGIFKEKKGWTPRGQMIQDNKEKKISTS